MISMKSINVGDKFRRQNMPSAPALQPTDYTAYSQGAKKIGLISQDGLVKRKVDAEILKRSCYANYNKPSGGTGLSPLGIEVKPIPVDKREVISSTGILTVVDKFFNWVNKVMES